jgi:peptidoglycan/xylan/chitin deacetylase (PgdA/CDA1 family)
MNEALFELKTRFFKVLNRSGLPQAIIARSRWRIVLAFHRVIPKSRALELGLHPSLFTTPETFRRLLSSLKRMGNFVDLYSLFSDTSSGTSFFVTFDDGWIDTYTIAYPILKELNIPFSIFIATSLIDNGVMNWTEEITAQYFRLLNTASERAKKALRCLNHQNSSEVTDVHELIEKLKELPSNLRKHRIERFYSVLGITNPIMGEMLSWAQIKQLREEGIIIGSHTHSHSILKGMNKEDVAAELKKSKEIIQDRLAYNPESFCYPNGRYDRTNEDIFKDLGYRYGFILDDKRVHPNDSLFFIPRFLVYEDIVPILYFRFVTEHK